MAAEEGREEEEEAPEGQGGEAEAGGMSMMMSLVSIHLILHSSAISHPTDYLQRWGWFRRTSGRSTTVTATAAAARTQGATTSVFFNSTLDPSVLQPPGRFVSQECIRGYGMAA